MAEEVRRAVADLHAKARLVALSRERLKSAKQQRRGRRAEGGSRPAGHFWTCSPPNLDWYKARNQLTVDVMAWHTARAKVREAQGLLVWECCGKSE